MTTTPTPITRCTTCAMRADADPEFHAERYGHWPTVRNEAGETVNYTAPEIDPADEIDYDRERRIG